MIKIDVVCTLFNCGRYIDNLINGIKNQKGVTLGNVVFPITEKGDTSKVKEKISNAGFKWFSVNQSEFSHSLTREKAVLEYCENDIVIMISQDVKFVNDHAFSFLAASIKEDVVYSYGKQVCSAKSIEYYVRKKNYGDKSEIISANDIGRLGLRAFFASDAFCVYHRPTFVELNGYGHVPMMMSEDMFYAKKIIDAGYKKAYVAEAIVEHSHKFTLKQLYRRYYETGKWFAAHPEFNDYKVTDTGLKLAFYVLGQALKHFNIPVLIRWFPDMAARYLGMKKGKKSLKNEKK